MMKKVLIVLVVVGVVALGVYFVISKKNGLESAVKNINSNTSTVISESNSTSVSNENTNGNEVAIAFYENGIGYFNDKEYEKSIVEFDQAIALDKLEPNYYSKKAQAQSNLQKTDEAIATINEGLKLNPASDLLKTRLDILQRDWVGKQEQ